MSMSVRGHVTRNLVRLTATCLTFCVVAAASAQTQIPSNSRLKAVASAKTIKIAYRDRRQAVFLCE